MKKLDVIGHKYGRLTIISEAPSRESSNRSIRYVNALCDCGNITEVGLNPLRKGTTTSCGCFRKEVTGDMSRKHGAVGTRLHRIWKAMRVRCNNPNTQYYQYYGARGITVCAEWDDFKLFHDWATNSG